MATQIRRQQCWPGVSMGRVSGVGRVLDLLARYEIRSTFFVPGHTIDSFPDKVAMIIEAGHEIAHHSYAHVDPAGQSELEERRDMERALEALERIGIKPKGYRSPSAAFSEITLPLLVEYGLSYDSSLMADDFTPYQPRLGDKVSQHSPLIMGELAPIWEVPMCFEFDDWVHFQYNFTPYRNGTSAPGKVLEIWTKDFDWMHENVVDGVLTVAMHPQVIGRGHRIAMLEQFIQHCLASGDVSFKRIEEVVAGLPDFKVT